MGNRRIESDLNWYWTWSEGEISAPSNFMAMVTAIRLGCTVRGGPQRTDLDEGRLEAASRARPISRALASLSTADRRVLYAAYGPHACELPVFGRSAPVAALTAVARTAHRDSHTSRSMEDWLVRLAWRVSNREGNRVLEDSATANAIATEANAMLFKATRSYSNAFCSPPPRRGLRLAA